MFINRPRIIENKDGIILFDNKIRDFFSKSSLALNYSLLTPFIFLCLNQAFNDAFNNFDHI
jgi:hypothetical protein